MNLQHLNFKIFADTSIPLDLAIPVFHQWIQKKATEELLIDVADYRHVPFGPGVMLIAHEANLSLDESEGRLGFLYNRKQVMEGDNRTQLIQVCGKALQHANRLQQEPLFEGKLRFRGDQLQIIANDRLLVPNTAESFSELQQDLHSFFDKLYSGVPFSVSRENDPRKRLTLNIQVQRNFSLEQLIAHLS